jgi:hypothetical protein
MICIDESEGELTTPAWNSPRPTAMPPGVTTRSNASRWGEVARMRPDFSSNSSGSSASLGGLGDLEPGVGQHAQMHLVPEKEIELAHRIGLVLDLQIQFLRVADPE